MASRTYSGGRIRITDHQAAVIVHLATEALAETPRSAESWYLWALRDLREKARPHVPHHDTAVQRLLGAPAVVGHTGQEVVGHNAGTTTEGP